MYFESISALLQMDGHGIYVWSAYLLTLGVIAAIINAPWQRRRRFLRQLAGELKRRRDDAGTAKEKI